MKKLLIIILFLSSDLVSWAQKENFRFNIGIVKRFFPLSLEDKPYSINRKGIFFDSDRQFSNFNLSIDISTKIIHERFTLQISNYLRYGHNHYQRIYVPNGYEEVKKIKTDHFLDLIYSRRFRKTSLKYLSLNLGAGFGIMNVNSNYRFLEAIGTDSLGNPYKVPVHGSFMFGAPRAILGMAVNRFNFIFTMNITPDENYERYFTIWPELKASYNIFR